MSAPTTQPPAPSDDRDDSDVDTAAQDTGDLSPAAIWVASRWRSILGGLAIGFLGLAIGIFAATPRLPDKDSADAGFVVDMMYHHDQAVRMALLVLGRSDDPTVNRFAKEVVIDQRWEMGTFARLMQEWKLEGLDPDSPTMGWMGMTMRASEMSGIQPEDRVKQLGTLTGAELDRQFLTMMRDHHRGGIEMADYEAAHGDDAILRNMAATMARNQRQEIDEYTVVLRERGLE